MAKEGQGDVAKALADTRLLIDGTTITADLSQWGTDLTGSGAGAYESPSARTAIAFPRSIVIQADATSDGPGSQGFIINHGDQGDTFHGYRIEVASAGFIFTTSNDGTLATVTGSWLTGVASSTLIIWSTYEDPEIIGRTRHEFAIHDQDAADDDSWVIAQATGDGPSAVPGDDLTIGGRWNGATISDPYAEAIDWVQIGVRFHSVEEAKQQFVTQDAAPANDGADYTQRLPIPVTSNLGDDNEFAGWQYLYSNSAHIQNARRLLSPIWQMVAADAATITDDITDDFGDPDGGATSNAAWTYNIPDSDGYQTSIAWWCWRPIPNTCNRIHVRVHAQLWATSGSPDLLELRFYTANAPPESFVLATEVNTLNGTRVQDDLVGGVGGWIDMGEVKIARDPDRGTWLYLGVRMNGGTPTADTRAKIKAITVAPIHVNAGDDEWEGGWQG